MKKGKAFGFFDCRASKKEIEAEIPTIRDLAQIPSVLELSLTEGVDRLEKDPALMSVAKKAKDSKMRYVMEATYPGGTNKQAADEVAATLNQAYNSPLYEEGEAFRGGIVYKDTNGEYVFRE